MRLKNLLKIALISISFILFGCDDSSSAINEKSIVLNAEQMMRHVKAFQTIADNHGGNRAIGSRGGLASKNYILEQIKNTPYKVELHPFKNDEEVKGNNLIVEIPGQSKDKIIMIGAHYDSVEEGAGINDNASGVAVLLSFIEQISQAKITPKNSIYLAFWDGEETGMDGSSAYVNQLNTSQLKQIKAYINLDMVGTQDPVVLIGDADKSSLIEMERTLRESEMDPAEYQPLVDTLNNVPTHPGDIALEKMLKTFFGERNIVLREDTASLIDTDTEPFLGKVPIASIIFFNEQLKGDEIEFAPCYHSNCDNIDKISPSSLKLAADILLYLVGEIEKQN